MVPVTAKCTTIMMPLQLIDVETMSMTSIFHSRLAEKFALFILYPYGCRQGARVTQMRGSLHAHDGWACSEPLRGRVRPPQPER